MTADRLPRMIRAVQRGVRWLKEQAPHIHDPRSVAVTISALVAAERNPHSQLVQRLAANLAKQQLPDGSWSDELWDTTYSVSALRAAGWPVQDPAIQKALRFFQATQDPMDGTWYEEPFETLLVLDLICALTPERLQYDGVRAIDWLYSLQREDGFLLGTRYTGMAISLFAKLPPSFHDRSQAVVQRGVTHLRATLKSRPIWTGAAWSNYYALKALVDTGATLDDPALSTAVDWFLETQEEDGKWDQVSPIHDTAMATIGLSSILTAPLVDVPPPKLGVLSATRENGVIRVSFHGPGAGAISLAERLKVSEAARKELVESQRKLLAMVGNLRGVSALGLAAQNPSSLQEEIVKMGRYTYGHLIPPRIQLNLEQSVTDHLRLDIDEKLIDLPWELIHDGTDFACVRYALGRRLVSDQAFSEPQRKGKAPAETSVLVVANTTGDLPSSEAEGAKVTELLTRAGLSVDYLTGGRMAKTDFLLALQRYDIVHFAGHATHDSESPDESCLLFKDGKVSAFEIARFLAPKPPSIVFLNACWSGREKGLVEEYSPMMRSLGRVFMYGGVGAYVGYFVPVPDLAAARFATAFYAGLTQGNTIGESVRQARVRTRDPAAPSDVTWASAVLYGDPAARLITPPAT